MNIKKIFSRELELLKFYRRTFRNWLSLFLDYNLFNLLWLISKRKLVFPYARKHKIIGILKNNDMLHITWRALPITILNDKEYTRYPEFVPKKGDIILDAGAHIGIYSYLAASKGAEVISIEPLPENLDLLRKNANYPNVTILQNVLSHKKGKAVFYVAKNLLGHSLIQKTENKLIVDALTLKDLFKRFKKIDLMKIDIEGEELNILKNCKEEIKKIKRIVMETHNNHLQVLSYLKKYGFNVKVHDGGRLLYCTRK